jgi:hypothetical protein
MARRFEIVVFTASLAKVGCVCMRLHLFRARTTCSCFSTRSPLAAVSPA